MTGVAEVLHAALAVTTAIWALYNVPELRAPGPARSLWSGMAALSIGEALHTQIVYRAVDAATAPGWGAVLYHWTGTVAAIAVLDLLNGLLEGTPRSRRIRAGIGVCALVASALPLLIDPPAHLPPILDSDPVIYDNTWQSAAHWAVFLSFLAWSLISATLLCRRVACEEDDPLLRTGLQLICAGTAVGLLYVVGHSAIEIAVWFPGGRAATHADGWMDAATLGTSIALIVLGAGWQQGWALADAIEINRAMRATRQRLEIIWPHWQHLVDELPEISPFAADMQAPATEAEHLQWQQHRVVIEIYDAMRRLLPYVSDEEKARIAKNVTEAGLRDEEAQTATTSICIQLAIKIRHTNPVNGPTFSGDPDVPAATAAQAATQIAASLQRLQSRKVQRAIGPILEEVSP